MSEDTTSIPDPLRDLAAEHFHIPYLFPYQRLVISNILEAAGVEGFAPEAEFDRVSGEREVRDTRSEQIVILPTGAGKSLCFMLPAFLLSGATLIVFPLLSLMADQARRVEEAGMKPGILRGGQTREERKEVFDGVQSGSIKILITNPETALSPVILKELKALAITHLVIDETHTVSEWGDTFRPTYLDIGRLSREAGIPVVTAFTATASPVILQRIKEIIFPENSPNIIAANPDRENITYRVIPVLSRLHELTMLLAPGSPSEVRKPAIVFCSSRRGTEILAADLRERLGSGQVRFYHAGLSKDEKKRIEQWFFTSRDGILVATCAYGMGIDKPDIRTVIHADIPQSVEAYLQESGRGGRDRTEAEAILLISTADIHRQSGSGTARERFRALVGMARSPCICRRAYLMKLMGAPETACSGCDVCDGKVKTVPEGYREILSFVKANRRVFTLRETAGALKGRRITQSISPPSFLIPGFGSLASWDEADIEEALKALRSTNIIKTAGFGKGQYRLYPGRIKTLIRQPIGR